MHKTTKYNWPPHPAIFGLQKKSIFISVSKEETPVKHNCKKKNSFLIDSSAEGDAGNYFLQKSACVRWLLLNN